MLDSNSAFFRAITASGFVTNGYSAGINIYSGDAPTDEFIEQHVSGNEYDIISMTNALPVSNTLLGTLGFESTINAEYEGDDHFVLPLSDSTREIVVKETGVASWFMLYSVPKALNDDPTSQSPLTALQIIVGTVGDLGSGADLELPESSLDINKDYKCNDITVSLI